MIISTQNPSKMPKSHRQFSLLESSTTTSSSYRSSSDTFCDIGKNNQSEQPSGRHNHQQLTSPTLYEDDDSSYTFVLSDIPSSSTRNPRQPSDPGRSYRSELSFRLPASPPPTSVTTTNLIDLGSPPQSPYIPGFPNFSRLLF